MAINYFESELRPDGLWHYWVGPGFAPHSATLAELDVLGESETVRVENGDVFLAHGDRWMSPLMTIHSLLVFFGLCPLGRSSLNFPYGQPWAYKASLIRRLLVTHRAEMAVSRCQVAAVFTAELRLVGFPLARVVGFVVGVSLPRRGWLIG